ncbi:hypothetical protein Poly51_63770 [Rubripirellula tenax]|uniref:Uncharacterized protein n=1 Tax=Rubripirellula tenax TaxID=2528015 RepID=A0A5C6DZ25_9BACT|nr:hypothetical protein [Rubripirellula tenax]TWU41695.1 hypothetical protein Poly51_63770 [Rubripirellula tenax]
MIYLATLFAVSLLVAIAFRSLLPARFLGYRHAGVLFASASLVALGLIEQNVLATIAACILLAVEFRSGIPTATDAADAA